MKLPDNVVSFLPFTLFVLQFLYFCVSGEEKMLTRGRFITRLGTVALRDR